MVVLMLFNKLHRLLLSILGVFRRALCCFRKRHRSPSLADSDQLTHIGIISNREPDISWEWKEALREPKTVQDHIDLYRQKKQEAMVQAAEVAESQNYFEDMTPNITRQTKVYLGSDRSRNMQSRLQLVEAAAVDNTELQEWDEASGWEGQTLDHDAQEALKLKKRQEHERRMLELQQKRMDKNQRSLGVKVGT